MKMTKQENEPAEGAMLLNRRFKVKHSQGVAPLRDMHTLTAQLGIIFPSKVRLLPCSMSKTIVSVRELCNIETHVPLDAEIAVLLFKRKGYFKKLSAAARIDYDTPLIIFCPGATLTSKATNQELVPYFVYAQNTNAMLIGTVSPAFPWTAKNSYVLAYTK